MDQVREQIAASYRRDAAALAGLLSGADRSSLAKHSEGTRWSNEQLLFHMVFDYMVVRALIPLVHLLIKCPPWIRSAFCAVLNPRGAQFRHAAVPPGELPRILRGGYGLQPSPYAHTAGADPSSDPGQAGNRRHRGPAALRRLPAPVGSVFP
ncbi:hypothetical protein [Glutamicibacter sp. HZAU]|uniref:hypothetical protein n=1 Tax=Glutamicibacter sp. HZAU TaxID=2049891 RepID=UPI001F2AA73A|nr:hypothetical protein [Glutamicibacter sp. HZAU]